MEIYFWTCPQVDEKEDPDDGAIEEEDKYRESKQRFRKSKDQELVEYLADGVKIGEEMRQVTKRRLRRLQNNFKLAKLLCAP